MIMGGIVTFNPKIDRLNENISAIAKQVKELVIVDNGSKNIDLICEKFGNKGITIIKLGKNMGIAKALNVICEYAIVNKYEWLLTLDQDSVLRENSVNELKCYLNDDIGIISPAIYDVNTSIENITRSRNDIDEIEKCITSASLLNLNAYTEAGGFTNELFIDYVDYDICAKLREKGYKILRVNSVVLNHEIGHAKRIDFFYKLGKIFHIKKLQKYVYTYNHSPLRTYYFTRNSVYYIRRFQKIIDIKKEKYEVRRWLILKVVFEKNKIKQIKAIIKGIKDGKKMRENL